MKRSKAAHLNERIREVEKSRMNGPSSVIPNTVQGADIPLENWRETVPHLAKIFEHDVSQFIVCQGNELLFHILPRKRSKSNSWETPLFVIWRHADSTHIFSTVKIMDRAYCLYIPGSGTRIPTMIELLLQQCYGDEMIFKSDDCLIRDGIQKHASVHTLLCMLTGMIDVNRMNFIEKFGNPEYDYDDLIKVINDTKEQLLSVYYKIASDDIMLLANDAPFKKAISDVLKLIPSVEQYDNVKKYHLLLKDLVENEEKGISLSDEEKKKIDAAKDLAFKCIDAKNLEKQTQKNGNLDIWEKFPDQMKKLSRIFQLLTDVEADESLDEQLRRICEKLDLDYEKLKTFFKGNENKSQETATATNIDSDYIALLDECLRLNNSSNKAEKCGRKPLDKIFEELEVDDDTYEFLEIGYESVKGMYSEWMDKNVKEINQWCVSQRKKGLAYEDIYEAIAVMDRANELTTGGHRLHDTQILAILTFLREKENGQLTQIQTGEGKTVIVAVVAAILTLQGVTVDIVTSNPILAGEAVREKKLFFDVVGLTVTTNNFDENYKMGERACYGYDIVYGTIANFQFDYLKDTFLGLKTRGKRLFHCILLDEVDSMILDNASHIAKLAESLPGMESLKYVYIRIFQELCRVEKKMVEDFQVKFREKAIELDKLPDSANPREKFHAYRTSLQDKLIPGIKEHIKSTNPVDIHFIPSHIKKYANKTLDRWINSAIDARYNYSENEQYVIREKDGEKVIQPVDHANTGMTLKNTVWQYALHQFLQLMHNLNVTAETLTSCFISNFGYIMMYDRRCGLTGTLGSDAERRMFSSIYAVDCSEIPTYIEKKFKELPGVIVEDELFVDRVAQEAINVRENRAILIICQTIKDAKNIFDKLQGCNINVKEYYDEEHSHVSKEPVNKGDVILASNMGGRGTHFEVSDELEKNGGLHVCKAFLPCNKRVGAQADGRTARQGKRGSANLIIRRSEVDALGISTDSFDAILAKRDANEEARIQLIREFKVPELKFKDELFRLFSQLFCDLRLKHRSLGQYRYVLNDLKEFWAFWLESTIPDDFDWSQPPEEIFEKFKSEADSVIKGNISFNPYYSIQQAEYYIGNDNLDAAEKAAKNALEICENPEILHSAYFKLFEISIERGKVFLNKCVDALGSIIPIPFEPDKEYKMKARDYLEKAQRALIFEFNYIKRLFEEEYFVEYFESIREENASGRVNENRRENYFVYHIESRLHAIQLYIAHTMKLIQQINDFRDDIAIKSRVPDYFIKHASTPRELKLKDSIHNSELLELANLGTNTNYALKSCPNVPDAIKTLSQTQVYGGLGILSSGVCFPPAFPIASAVGGTMITEGICDVVTEVIKTGDKPFDQAAYIKGKMISYGMAFLTLGADALMQCPKILKKARDACLWLSEKLRKCPYLVDLCELLAKNIDKYAIWFEELLVKCCQLAVVEKTCIQSLCCAVEEVCLSTAKGFKQSGVGKVIMRRITMSAVESALLLFRQKIRESVRSSVEENIDREKLQRVTIEEVKRAMDEVTAGNQFHMIRNKLKLAMDMNNNGLLFEKDWRLHLGCVIASDLSYWAEILVYTKDFCVQVNKTLRVTDVVYECIDPLIVEISDRISNDIFRMISEATLITANDLYSSRSFFFGSGQSGGGDHS